MVAEKNRWWVILLFNLLYYSLLLCVLPVQFEGNDDVLMCMIANGVYGGVPDCHLVFMNALLGFFLKCLYQVTHYIEWYTLYLVVIHIFSFTIIAHKIISAQNFDVFSKVIILAISYALGIRIILALQFTTTAGVAAFAGCLLILYGKKNDYVGAFFMLILSAITRFEVTGLILLLFSPLFIKMIADNKKNIRMFFLLALVIFCLPIIDNAFYSSIEWKEYKRYNYYRGKINDNPNFYRAENKLPKNISNDDYQMFIWGVGDGKVFTIENVKAIYDILHHPSIEIKCKYIKNIIVSKKYFIPVIIICLLCILNIMYIKSSYKWYLLTMLLLFITVFIAISSNAYIKDRVFLCMLLPMIYIILVSNFRKKQHIPEIIFFCIVSYGLGSTIVKNKQQKLPNALICEQLDLLEKTKQTNDRVYNIDFRIAMQNVWRIKDIPARPVTLGWLTYYPCSKEYLLGYDDFINNDIVILSQLNEVAVIEQQQQYLLEKYNIFTEYNIQQKTEHYALFKLTKK